MSMSIWLNSDTMKKMEQQIKNARHIRSSNKTIIQVKDVRTK